MTLPDSRSSSFTFSLSSVGSLVLLVMLAWFQGWVLSLLWGWFVSPSLGLGKLGVIQILGLGMTVRLLIGSAYTTPSPTSADAIVPAVCLVLGWGLRLLQGYL
jgi:hypothetical protein